MQPLSAEIALGKTPILKEPRLIDEWVLWLEQRPHEGGRTTALIRPWGRSDLIPQELTPSPHNLRSRVHDYGGGVIATSSKGDQLVIVWVDDSESCLWMQSWQGLHNVGTGKQPLLKPAHKPIRLSSREKILLADGLIDLPRQRWLGVMEAGERDFLVTFSLNREHQSPTVLYQPKDFIGYAALSPKGDQLAWVEWNQSAMPWDSSELWWAQLDDSGEFIEKALLAGSNPNQTKNKSVFQPMWLSSGELAVSEDSNGWWNVMVLGPGIKPQTSYLWRRLWPMELEAAMPQWVYGMSTKAAAGDQILSAICDSGSWQLSLLNPDGSTQLLDQPFDDIAGLHGRPGRAVAIASNSFKGPGILELDTKLLTWQHTQTIDPIMDEEEISVAESFWFRGYRGEKTHCWYYPPKTCNKETPP